MSGGRGAAKAPPSIPVDNGSLRESPELTEDRGMVRKCAGDRCPPARVEGNLLTSRRTRSGAPTRLDIKLIDDGSSAIVIQFGEPTQELRPDVSKPRR